ncbi:MAG: hypothetical protein COB25_006635 [Oceanospirillales bacterium]|nr:hypothetical protein [Oceanospirillales bacterium]
MTHSKYFQSSLALALLEIIPPLIRNTLLEKKAFCEEYDLQVDATVSLGSAGALLQRSELFEAMRAVLEDGGKVNVPDAEGCNWIVSAVVDAKGQPATQISSNGQKYILRNYSILSPEKSTRLHFLEQSIAAVNLPVNAAKMWHDILTERDLEDVEVDQFYSDLDNTPVQIVQSIRDELQVGRGTLPSLVPQNRKYFERLVGKYDNSASIKDYAGGSGKVFMEELSEWQSYDGFLFSLFMSSHFSLTAEISVEKLNDEDLKRAFEFLIEKGDRVSQLGAIEIGLRVLPERQAIEPLLVRLVTQIRDDDIESAASGYKLLSALFILVDGELSKRQLLSDTPPFFRRLASLSQAALIHRQVISVAISRDQFGEWALGKSLEQFCMQSLADMRLEPHWNPDSATAAQMKADACGRLMNAARSFEKNIPSGELRNILISVDSGSLASLYKSYQPYFAGPLEGDENSSKALPDDLAKIVETQLRTEGVRPSTFVALVNSAFVSRVDEGMAKLAAEKLRAGKHLLADIEERSQLLAILRGLAIAAAVSRGQDLANELRILVRRYRRDAQYALSIEEVLSICLMASASRRDLNEWKEIVGDWLTELAFEDFQPDEGEALYSHLQCLLRAVPELWATCGRADAALRAYLGH